MQKLTLALAFVLALATGAAGAQDRMTGPDKKLHFAVSAFLGAGIAQAEPDPWKAWAWAMLPGLAKELSDTSSSGTGFSVRDMIANGIGAYVGVKLGGLIVGPRYIGIRTKGNIL